MDRYAALAASPAGRLVLPRLGLPTPPVLRRYAPGQPLTVGPVLLGPADGGRLADAAAAALSGTGVDVRRTDDGQTRYGALVLDADDLATVEDLERLHAFFSPTVRRLADGGRVLVLAGHPQDAADAEAAVVQRALEGFTRSVGKEVGGQGATSQLVRVAPGAQDRIGSTLHFLLSARSAFVSGQVVEIGTDVDGPVDMPDWDAPLAGRVVVVTGASRGIGEAIATTVARDGGTVVAVDVPAAASGLADVARRTGGSYLALDVTAPDAAARIARHAAEHHDGLHGIVHNAGITRDKRLRNMSADRWRQVLEVNLAAPLRITTELVADGVLAHGSRVVGVSSVAGLAGNTGQTNYATSKAGVAGLVDRLSADLAGRGITVNAVAPGFIETQMTAAVPVGVRQAGRRLSSLNQGGLPVDVAETIGWLLWPASTGVTGNVVRVCGQALIGA